MTDAEMQARVAEMTQRMAAIEADAEKISAALARCGLEYAKLAAELAAREQAAWRAGRDAAAVTVENTVRSVEDVAVCASAVRAIRALAPPATLAAAATVDAVADGLKQVGDRLECVACEEVDAWCQCEPSPFRARGGSASA